MSPRKTTVAVIVNFTGTDDDLDVVELRRHHRALGMIDVGYHFVIPRHGDIQHGRDEALCGNHTPGRNRDTIGIIVAAKSMKTTTATQKQIIEFATRALADRYNIPSKEIYIHDHA